MSDRLSAEPFRAGSLARLSTTEPRHDRKASPEVCDNGKPGESRRRKATRLQRESDPPCQSSRRTIVLRRTHRMRTLVLAGVAFLIVAACSGEPASQTIYGSDGPPRISVAKVELRPNQ